MAGSRAPGWLGRRRIGRWVDAAERTTGLQLVVYVGDAADPAARASELLPVRGVPAVLVLVALDTRRVEVRTDPAARDRVPDEVAARCVELMTAELGQGRLLLAVRKGLETLVEAAGPGATTGPELPDLVGP